MNIEQQMLLEINMAQAEIFFPNKHLLKLKRSVGRRIFQIYQSNHHEPSSMCR